MVWSWKGLIDCFFPRMKEDFSNILPQASQDRATKGWRPSRQPSVGNANEPQQGHFPTTPSLSLATRTDQPHVTLCRTRNDRATNNFDRNGFRVTVRATQTRSDFRCDLTSLRCCAKLLLGNHRNHPFCVGFRAGCPNIPLCRSQL